MLRLCIGELGAVATCAVNSNTRSSSGAEYCKLSLIKNGSCMICIVHTPFQSIAHTLQKLRNLSPQLVRTSSMLKTNSPSCRNKAELSCCNNF